MKASPLPPAPFWVVAVWVVAGVAKGVVLDLVCLVSWVCCLFFVLVGLVGVVGLFFIGFSLLGKDPMLVVFFHCFLIFHGLWELGGHFFGDFGVLGSSLDALGAPGGSREPTLSK